MGLQIMGDTHFDKKLKPHQFADFYLEIEVRHCSSQCDYKGLQAQSLAN